MTGEVGGPVDPHGWFGSAALGEIPSPASNIIHKSPEMELIGEES